MFRPHRQSTGSRGRTIGCRPLTRAAVLLCSSALLAAGCGSSGLGTTATTAKSFLSGAAARGQTLYAQDGCSGCHSLDGTRLTGPTWRGLAGSRVQLSSGRSVRAGNAYLRRHIVEPQAFTVAGYPGEVMAQATAPLQLRRHPAEVRALVAFIDSLR